MSLHHQNSTNKSETSLNIFKQSKETLRDHSILCLETDRALENLLNDDRDPFLFDLPADITYEEVLAFISVVKGVGLTIYLERGDLSKLKVIIPKTPSTVTINNLKQSIRHAYELEQKRNFKKKIVKHKKKQLAKNSLSSSLLSVSTAHKTKSKLKKQKSKHKFSSVKSSFAPTHPPKINWRYIWKTYVLSYDKNPMLDNKQSLSSYGIANKACLCFVKRVKIAKKQKKKRI